MKILFVENHRTFADTVTGLFLTKHEVTTIGSVMEALDLCRHGSFDVVLVDYDLDDFKGDVLVRRLRAGGSKVPVIAISGKDEGNTLLLEAGANAVCHKEHFRQIGAVLERVRLPKAEESSTPSQSTWSYGVIPLGVTFLVTYDAKPAESNPEHDQLGGAFVNCWVVADSLDSALRITTAHLVENGWAVVDRIEARTAPPEDFDGDPYFRQVQIDGLVAVFHTYPRDELDLN